MSFKCSSSEVPGVLATCVWLVFMACHILVLYTLWFLVIISFIWLIIPVIFHVGYLSTIGKNVSAR